MVIDQRGLLDLLVLFIGQELLTGKSLCLKHLSFSVA